jgi:peroxiredoxin
MFKENRKTRFSLPVAVLVMVLAAAAILTGCKKTAPEQPTTNRTSPQNEQLPSDQTSSTAPKTATSQTAAPSDPDKAKPQSVTPTDPKKSLTSIIRAARSWGPNYTSLINKEAPDFTLTDINGKKHKLSDYRGKKVVLMLWATWCPPCKTTIPHLMELRKAVGEDKLAIMGISHITEYPPNTAEIIKQFAEDRKINYTVIAAQIGSAGDPYDAIHQLPTLLFIEPDGTIKLSATGSISLAEFKAILEAEWP